MSEIEFTEEDREEQCPQCGEVYWEDIPICMDCENRVELELARYQI